MDVNDTEWFFSVVRAAFGQRRKTALNVISALLGTGKDAVRDAMAEAGIAENARAETLTMEQFAALAENLRKK